MRLTHSLRNRLLFSITSIMVIGMLVTSVISYIYSKQALQTAVGHNMLSTVETCRKQIDSWVEDLASDLKSWTHNPLITDSLQNDEVELASNFLKTVKNDYPYYENLGILNRQGIMVAGSNPALIGKLNLADRDYFRSAMAGQVAISKPVASRDTSEPIFVLAVPIANGDQIEGTLFAAVTLSSFSQISPVQTAHCWRIQRKIVFSKLIRAIMRSARK